MGMWPFQMRIQLRRYKPKGPGNLPRDLPDLQQKLGNPHPVSPDFGCLAITSSRPTLSPPCPTFPGKTTALDPRCIGPWICPSIWTHALDHGFLPWICPSIWTHALDHGFLPWICPSIWTSARDQGFLPLSPLCSCPGGMRDCPDRFY